MKTIKVSLFDQTVEIKGACFSFEELGLMENLGQYFVPLGSGEIRDLIVSNYPDCEVEFCDHWEGVLIDWEMDYAGRIRARIKKSLAQKLHEKKVPHISPEQLIGDYYLTTNHYNTVYLCNRYTEQLIPVARRHAAYETI